MNPKSSTFNCLLVFFLFQFLFSSNVLKTQKLHRIFQKINSDFKNSLRIKSRKLPTTKSKKNPFGKSQITAIVINDPDAIPKKIKAKESVQSPIIFMPQILVPGRKKQLVIHHSHPMDQQYQNMATSQNHSYMKMANMNPYWKDIIQDNQFATSVNNDPDNQVVFKQIKLPKKI